MFYRMNATRTRRTQAILCANFDLRGGTRRCRHRAFFRVVPVDGNRSETKESSGSNLLSVIECIKKPSIEKNKGGLPLKAPPPKFGLFRPSSDIPPTPNSGAPLCRNDQSLAFFSRMIFRFSPMALLGGMSSAFELRESVYLHPRPTL